MLPIDLAARRAVAVAVRARVEEAVADRVPQSSETLWSPDSGSAQETASSRAKKPGSASARRRCLSAMPIELSSTKSRSSRSEEETEITSLIS